MADTADAERTPTAGRLDPVGLYVEAVQRRGGPRSMLRILGRAVRLTWRTTPRGFLSAAGLQVFGALSAIALVVVSKIALDAVIAAGSGIGADTQVLVLVVVLLAVVTAVGTAAAAIQELQQRLLSEEVSVAIWNRVLDVTSRVGLEMYESPKFYDQLQRVQFNALARPITVTTSTFNLLGGAVGTVGLVAVLVSIEPLLAPALLVGGVPAVVLSRRAGHSEFRFATGTAALYRARDYLRGLLAGRDEAKEVRAFGAERALRARHDERSRHYLTALRRQTRTRKLFALGGVAVTASGLALSLGLLVVFLNTGRITVADAGAAALAVRLLSSRLGQTLQSIGGLFESAVFLEDLERFLGLGVVADGAGTGRLPPFERYVAAEAVSYTYPGGAEPAVREVSVRIGAGEVVAIVGENGSGKTTLAKLIAGLYRPTEGRVVWDGVDSAQFEPADVRRGVAVIFQDFVRYQLSALENIGIGDPDHIDDEAAARAAAQRSGAGRFLDRLPDGYATMLSKEFDGGRDLSVGQWQRVALARALRRDAPLVIFDEPSSALDPRAEMALFGDVKAMLGGRSALLISHRYSTARMADRIYVMESGRVVEAGSHDSLMEIDGLYADLFSLQAKAYR